MPAKAEGTNPKTPTTMRITITIGIGITIRLAKKATVVAAMVIAAPKTIE